MNIITLGNTTIRSPRTWNELSVKQLYYIASQWQGWKKILTSKQKGIKTEQNKAITFIRVALLQVMLDINPFNIFSAQTRAFRKVAPAQMIDMLDTTDFIFEKNTLTENKLPRMGKLHGPADDLFGITTGEFAALETCFLKYHIKAEEKYLNQLCAVLYRKGDKAHQEQVDKREKFNDKTLGSRTKKIKRWKAYQRQAVLLFYIGCREKIITQNQIIFQIKGNGDKSKQNWGELIIDLAGPKFGTVDQVSEQPLTNMLFYLKKLKREAEVKK